MNKSIEEIIALGMFNVSIDSGEILDKDIKKIEETASEIKDKFKRIIEESKPEKKEPLGKDTSDRAENMFENTKREGFGEGVDQYEKNILERIK
jgi:hypothetical protein